jgi:hypothetical protein
MTMGPRQASACAEAALIVAVASILPFVGLTLAPCAAVCGGLALSRDGGGRRLAVAGLTVALTMIVWQLLLVAWTLHPRPSL